jgi:lipoprotein signal peptidase
MRTSERLLLLVAPAAALASVDLFVKSTVPTASWAFHHRSGAWMMLCVALLVGTGFLSLVPSASVAVAGGVMSAGVIGNLVSARADGNWVPNPLIVHGAHFTVAFNLADVFFLVGNLLLMTTLAAEAVRHRDRLARLRH